MVLKSGGVNLLTVVGLDIGDIARSKKIFSVLEDETRKGHGFLSFKSGSSDKRRSRWKRA